MGEEELKPCPFCGIRADDDARQTLDIVRAALVEAQAGALSPLAAILTIGNIVNPQEVTADDMAWGEAQIAKMKAEQVGG